MFLSVVVGGAIAILRLLRCAVAPAIAAGLLPLVLGVTSWWYPPSIFFGTALLTLVWVPWRRRVLALAARFADLTPSVAPEASCHPPYEVSLRTAALLVFVLLLVACVQLTGARYLLFPPLVVLTYELLRDPAECPWAGAVWRLPSACGVTAAGGLVLQQALPCVPLAALLAMGWGVAVLHIFRLHLPPALAVGLLPLVMHEPSAAYPLAVGAGTALAVGWCVAFAAWFAPGRPAR